MASASSYESRLAELSNPNSPHMLKLESAVQLLDSDPDSAFAKANAGSLVHVHVLKYKVDTLPPKRQEDALKMFCSHLDPRPNLSHEEHTLSKVSFEGIANMKVLFNVAAERKIKNDTHTNFEPILVENLSRILDWCRATSKSTFDLIQDKGLVQKIREDLRSTVDLLLALELSGPDVRELLPDDVLSIALTAWWYEDLAIEDWPNSGHASAFLTSYLRGKRRRNPSAVFRMDKELTAADIASTALKKIQVMMEQIRSASGLLAFDALADNAVVASYLQQYILFGNMTSVRQRLLRDDIRAEFRKRGAGRLFAEAMKLLTISLITRRDKTISEDEPIHRAVWFCSSFLLDCCDFQGSWQILIQPLQSGLLSLVNIVLRFLSPILLAEFEFARKFRVLLKEVIPPYLVSHKFLDYLSKFMRRHSTNSTQFTVESVGLKAEWEAFERLVFELTVCHRLYELRYKDKVSNKDTEACHYCITPKLRISLQRCSGCQTALYCGRSCQTAAWSKHKKSCKGMGAEKKYTGFLKFLVMVDIRRHKKSIEAMDKNIPRRGQDLSPRVTAVDYTKTPHVISTISFEEYLKIRLLNGNENIPQPILDATPFRLHQSGTTSVRFLGSEDGVPMQRILFIEPVELELKLTTAEATAQYGSANADCLMRRKAYDENGKILQAERDDVDEVLEDIYEKIRSSPEEKLGIWDALDLVLPLKK